MPMSDMSPNAWREWLRSFRERFIAKQGWSEKEAKRYLRDGWAVARDRKITFVESAADLPEDARPVFQFLTPLGWKLPLPIALRLDGWIRDPAEGASLREVALEMLDSVLQPLDLESAGACVDDIKCKRDAVAQAVWCLLDACDAKELAEVIKSDAFWWAILQAMQFGRRQLLLELYANPELRASALKAVAFNSGKNGDALTDRLEARWLELRKKSGRNPKTREVAEAAGGVFDGELWEFEEADLSPRALIERIVRIKRRYT